MKIAIEALGIHAAGGGRTATLTTLENLKRIDQENQYTIYLSRFEASIQAKNFRQVMAPFKNRFLLRAWAQLALPWATRGHDLVHFMKNLGVFSIAAPSIVTMYDLTTLVHPELFPALDVWYWRYIQKRTLENADRIIAISQTTAADLVKYYDLSLDKIKIIYPAIAPHFEPASETEVESVRKKYGLPERYLIHVGHIDRKKNLTFLVDVFARFCRQANFDGNLVLVGEIYPKTMDHVLVPTVEKLGLQQRVTFTNFVPDEDLPALYSGAFAAVFPSLHEGFGLAPVEAMACGTPLIAHSAGAIPEVVGDAAIILDKLDHDAFADVLADLYSSSQRWRQLRHLGLQRSSRYSGENTARQTLELYREVANF
jgi:glycosyltransferase involved in cell wall biosynthesis